MKYYQSPRWSGEITDCSMPMTFDQYSKCSYKCLYCFSQYQKGVGLAKKGYITEAPAGVNVDKIWRLFTDPKGSQFADFIRRKRVIQWGGLADPFCNYERKYGTGLKVLRVLRDLDYPICFSTKGTWWLKDKRYTELFKDNKKWNVKISIITMDAEKAKIMEGGVDSPGKRLDAIGAVAKLNCGGATLRLRPFIIGFSDPHHIPLIKEAGARGATALSTEFFCLEVRSQLLRDNIQIFNRLCGFDVFKFYKKYSVSCGYLRLNRNVKRKFVDEMQEASRAAGMRFYVSDAHFKERCENGSCCGLDESWNYSRGQFCHALLICKNQGKVHFSDISDDLQYAKAFLWRQADGFNTNSAEVRSKHHYHTMYDYVRGLWNKPNQAKFPYRMFEGVMKPVGVDKNRDVIYEYDKTKE